MLLIARRYLLSPKSHSVVNIICGVSLISVMVPVAAVIILLSVFNGFGEMISDTNRAVEGDLTIERLRGGVFSRDSLDIDAIRDCQGVEQVSFATEQLVLLQFGSQNAVITLRGVDENYTEVVAIDENIRLGEFAVREGEEDRLVIGSSLVSKLDIRSLYDDLVEVATIKTNALYSVIPLLQYKQEWLNLAGMAMTDSDSDENLAYTSDRMVSRLIGRDSVATRLIVKVGQGNNIEATQQSIRRIIGDDFQVRRREELNPMTYNIVRYEKLGTMLICTLIMTLASFSLLGALTMLIIEKRNDVATLRAMGASRSDIRRIFLLEGGLISAVAIVSGVVIGSAITLVQQYFGVVEIPSQSMVVSYYPVRLMASDVVWVVAIAASIAAAVSWAVVNKMVKNNEIR